LVSEPTGEAAAYAAEGLMNFSKESSKESIHKATGIIGKFLDLWKMMG
jgi:hypothetical protein